MIILKELLFLFIYNFLKKAFGQNENKKPTKYYCDHDFLKYPKIMNICSSCVQNMIVWWLIKEVHRLSRYIVSNRLWNKNKLKFDY